VQRGAATKVSWRYRWRVISNCWIGPHVRWLLVNGTRHLRTLHRSCQVWVWIVLRGASGIARGTEHFFGWCSHAHLEPGWAKKSTVMRRSLRVGSDPVFGFQTRSLLSVSDLVVGFQTLADRQRWWAAAHILERYWKSLRLRGFACNPDLGKRNSRKAAKGNASEETLRVGNPGDTADCWLVNSAAYRGIVARSDFPC
jgi:hypothetical protein